MRTRLRLALLAAWAAAGCLPAGDPPRGQHLLDGRDSFVVSFQRTIPGAPQRLLLFSASMGAQMGIPGFTVDEIPEPDPATGRSEKRLLLDSAFFGDTACDGCPYAYDARGRLLLLQGKNQSPGGIFDTHLVRVDPETAEAVDLGSVTTSSVSSDRTLVLLSLDTLHRVLDLDGHETPLPPAARAEFVGNDVYFSSDQKLFRVRGSALSAAPELAADHVDSVQVVATARGPLLLLFRPGTDLSGAREHALFDPAAFAEMPFPGETGPVATVSVSPSPTGRFLMTFLIEPRGALTTTLFDRDTNTSQSEPIGGFSFNSHWRPEHEEVWIAQEGSVLRWRAGAKPEVVADAVSTASFVRPNGGPFTPDGRYWLSFDNDSVGASLRPTDDDAAEPLDLTPPGTSLSGYWPLPDGRGIAETFTTFQFHADLSLIDPLARTAQPIGSGGSVVAVGPHRVLAFVDWVKSTSSGTLALIDLDTGAHTVLGENVYSVALEGGPRDPDRLAPGKRVAFLVRHRIAGPYDGLWMATLP